MFGKSRTITPYKIKKYAADLFLKKMPVKISGFDNEGEYQNIDLNKILIAWEEYSYNDTTKNLESNKIADSVIIKQILNIINTNMDYKNTLEEEKYNDN